MHLGETAQQLLAGLRVAAHLDRRILLAEPAQAGSHLLLVALGLRRNREAHHRLRETDLRQLDLALGVEEHVARLRLLELRDGADVALAELGYLRVVLALQVEQLADPLFRVCAPVDDVRVGLERAVEDPEDVDAARERIGDRLEDERRGAPAVDGDRRALARRRGDALDEQIEQRRRPEVLRGDAARHGKNLTARDRVLERLRNFLGPELLAVEVALHQTLVGLDDRVEELLAVLVHLRLHLRGDLARAAFALAAWIHVRLHVEEVDDALQLVLRADRDVHRDAFVGQLLPHRVEHAEEVCALAVEHVHEEDAREPGFFGTRPVTRCLHLDAHHGADAEERAFDDAQRCNRVALEAGVAGCVDQVDLASLPLEVTDGRRERHLAPLLVIVPVADRGARLDRAQPVRRLGLEEQRLDERGLSRPTVSDDGDVADLARLDCH